ncbi:MAG: RNA polymerase sigma factor [Acidobacteriota bacterium]|nr:RNA polymerase sigma factor [Acidobacteriota bacterium]
MDEQQLIALVRDGDETAYDQIVHAYKDKIVNFLFQMTGDYQKAVDLSQETFLRVYFKADKYRPIAPLSSWIYAIASNLAKTDLKKRKRMPIVSFEDLPPTASLSTPSGEDSDSGLSANLRQALDKLSPRYRVPVLLKDVEGYSQEEIARMLKRPVGTIKARISRGRTMLKKSLIMARRDAAAPPKTEMIDEPF